MKSKPHIFPHSCLPDQETGKILSFMGPVRIYQPWFMSLSEACTNPDLEVVNPQEHLKPKEDLKSILSGCRQWAEQTCDRHYRETAKLGDKAVREEKTEGEIRRLLKGSSLQETEAQQEDKNLSLKRHLLLYLAADFDKQQFEVMEMMNSLKERKPVLEGALQDPEELQRVFSGAADFYVNDMQDNLNIGPVMDAWFGLFGEFIKENDLMITFNSRVFEYLSALWDDNVPEEKAKDQPPFSFCAPDLFSYGGKGSDMETGRFKAFEIVMKMRELILGFGEDPARATKELGSLGKEVEEMFSSEALQGVLKLKVRYFPAMTGAELFEGKDFLRQISGRTVLLVS
jgi:hypothetical protein